MYTNPERKRTVSLLLICSQGTYLSHLSLSSCLFLGQILKLTAQQHQAVLHLRPIALDCSNSKKCSFKMVGEWWEIVLLLSPLAVCVPLSPLFFLCIHSWMFDWVLEVSQQSNYSLLWKPWGMFYVSLQTQNHLSAPLGSHIYLIQSCPSIIRYFFICCLICFQAQRKKSTDSSICWLVKYLYIYPFLPSLHLSIRISLYLLTLEGK